MLFVLTNTVAGWLLRSSRCTSTPRKVTSSCWAHYSGRSSTPETSVTRTQPQKATRPVSFPLLTSGSVTYGWVFFSLHLVIYQEWQKSYSKSGDSTLRRAEGLGPSQTPTSCLDRYLLHVCLGTSESSWWSFTELVCGENYAHSREHFEDQQHERWQMLTLTVNF